MRLMFALLLLSGCPSSALPTATILSVESKYRVGPMIQTCSHAEELIPLVEQAWNVVLEEMERAGLLPDRVAIERELKGTRVCLVLEPDLCGPASTKCIGIPQCARRRGCASAWGKYVWIARWWPPVCRPEWKDEPNCVAEGQPRSSNYRSDLCWELANLAYQASGGQLNPHNVPAAVKAAASATKRLGW